MIKAVGIDIGASSIKVAEVLLSKKGPFIESLVEHPLPSDPTLDMELARLEVLKNIRDQYAGQDAIFSFSIPQSKVAYRFKTFPFPDRIKITKALPFELEEDLPFGLENAYWDSRIIRHFGSETDILAAAVTRHQVQKQMDTLGSLGLNIQKLTPAGSAAHAALSPLNEMSFKLPPTVADQSAPEPKNLRMVLDIGHSCTIVNLYDDEAWVNSSVVLWGGKNIAESISKRYEIPLDEALKVLKERGFLLLQNEEASYEQIVFSDTIANQIKYLAKELSLIVVGFETLHHGHVNSIQITGGVSSLVNMAPHLTQQIEIPVNTLHFLDQWPSSVHIDTQLENKMLVAVGLALEVLRKNIQPQYQFLQGPFAISNRAFEKFWDVAQAPLLWGGALVLTISIWSILRLGIVENLVQTIDDRVKQAGVTIAELNQRQSNPKQIRAYIRNAQNVINDRKLFEQAAKSPSAIEVLKVLSDAFPDRSRSDIHVTELTIQESLVKLKALAFGAEDKPRLIQALRRLSQNQTVQDLNTGSNQIIDLEFNLKTR